jgi:4-hydroxy-tetrahydrodipicolinate synthase
VALATTAEATSLTDAERELVIDACASVCAERSAPLLVGAGTADTRTSVARHRALGGWPPVRASLAVVPYYTRPSEQAIVRHFKVLARESPVPVVVYNIPYRTGRGLGTESLLALAATENVAGVKQAVGALDVSTLEVLRAAPHGFSVLSGDDAFVLAFLAMGGAGTITASAQLATTSWSAMVSAALAGEIERARGLHGPLLDLALALFAEPSPAVIKSVLHAEGRVRTPALRAPLEQASAAATDTALRALRAALPERISSP